MARIPRNPTTWAQAYTKVHLEEAARKKERQSKTKHRAVIVNIGGLNHWKLPNGRIVGSWHGTTPPNGAVSLGKGWWLDLRAGQIYRTRGTAARTFTYSEVDDYFNNTWNRTNNIDTALMAVEKKYGWLQRDRLERIHLHLEEEEE
ncbi:MAG: hypothetical protein PHW62_00750 [Candidatus Ratteibacteria bacterium]|nr:hypothetical protein [Candidatus Ratteibacteria bacterium]